MSNEVETAARAGSARDERVSEATAAEHGLTAEEFARIRKILGRDPNLTELGVFSVMWSEHCSYKSSKAHLKRLPTAGPQVIQGPGENAGVVDIGEGYCAVFKIESHNHPSFVEPFQGAATGVGGILRDIFTMGARPIAILDSLRFGPPAANGASREEAARNRRILDGVIGGIAFYGNCIGVATVGGEIQFEPCYSSNPLVNVLALGVARREELFFARARGEGNPVIYAGARTGRDGIHGASLLASAEFTEQSQRKRPNVQVGDPFMEKLLLEASLEAMASGAVVAIQDMGAAGLTCSTCEMASRGGMGIEIELARVPRRESGMTPYEILLSESQERMLLVAERGRENEVIEIFRKWGLEAVAIGAITSDGLLRVREEGRTAAEIPAHALAEEGPVYVRPMRPPAPPPEDALAECSPAGRDLTENFRRLLASPAIASKRWVFEQYDHMVRTNTLAGPGAGDAAVIRIKGTRRGLALATDGNGRWCALDPYLGAMHAVAEAARNVAATGARPLAATNCLNFGNPEKPEVMWQFSRVIDGIAEACGAFATPITGGNVSFYNETLGRAIYPTPVIGMLGLLEDASGALGAGFRAAGEAVLLLDGAAGTPADSSPGGGERLRREFSSSEYAKTVLCVTAGAPPSIDLAAEKRLVDCLAALAGERLVSSAHDLSDGGLAAALAECCFLSDGLGASVSLDGAEPAEAALFGERGARALVSAPARALARIRALAAQYAVKARELGLVQQKELRIEYNGARAIAAPVNDLRAVWAEALARALANPLPRNE